VFQYDIPCFDPIYSISYSGADINIPCEASSRASSHILTLNRMARNQISQNAYRVCAGVPQHPVDQLFRLAGSGDLSFDGRRLANSRAEFIAFACEALGM